MTFRSRAKRRIIASARLCAAVAALAAVTLSSGGAGAQAVSKDCLYVDSRQGWQRLPAPSGAIVDIAAEGTWTVLKGSVAPVGVKGHVGEAAQKLAVWTAYKFDQSYPFGAMLYRLPNGDTGSMADFSAKLLAGLVAGQRARLPGELELRINDSDSSLNDNAGRIRICLVHS